MARGWLGQLWAGRRQVLAWRGRRRGGARRRFAASRLVSRPRWCWLDWWLGSRARSWLFGRRDLGLGWARWGGAVRRGRRFGLRRGRWASALGWFVARLFVSRWRFAVRRCRRPWLRFRVWRTQLGRMNSLEPSRGVRRGAADLGQFRQETAR